MEIHGVSPRGLVTLLLFEVFPYENVKCLLMLFTRNTKFSNLKRKILKDILERREPQSLLAVAFLINMLAKHKLNQALQELILLQIELEDLRRLSRRKNYRVARYQDITYHLIFKEDQLLLFQIDCPNLIKKLVHHSLYSHVILKLNTHLCMWHNQKLNL